ncbi:MAG TPA: DMT family transporter [Acidimicrobiales bacterium]|nr:DMT family transporter [Acidimicrobiales bacterium]
MAVAGPSTAPAAASPVLTALTRRPALSAVAGALCIGTSGVLVRLADVAPATAAVFRFSYAVPVLGVLALFERRRRSGTAGGDRAGAARLAPAAAARRHRYHLVAGALFALDLVLWHHAIAAVGAGLATVLGNLQVLVVGLAAWVLLSERPDRRLLGATPVVLVGVVLISGAVGQGAYGDDPILGVIFGAATSVVYAGFILVHRQATRDGRLAGTLFEVTAVAAVVAAVLAAVTGELEVSPSWPAHGWLALLALTAQVSGWLFISVSLPRLPAAVTSMLLLLQPGAALLLAGVVLGEAPSAAQLVGAGLVLAGVVLGTARRRVAPATPPAPGSLPA